MAWLLFPDWAEPAILSRPALRVDTERYPTAVRSRKRAGSLTETGVARIPESIWNRQHLLWHAEWCLAVFSLRGAALQGRSFCACRWQALSLLDYYYPVTP